MLEKRSSTPTAVILDDLRTAALSAITTYGDDTRMPFEDYANPFTGDVSAYDIARLFFAGRGERDNPVTDLDGIVAIIRRTSGSDASRRAVARARWVAHELKRLGHHHEAQRFQRLATEFGA